jgi:Rhodopirellula transposase DDE domain
VTPKGLDHDPPPKRKWTPLGILMLASGALTILFCPRETSDSWADGLLLWWEGIRARMGHIKRLVIYLDNGPKNAGNRTQWLKRMVELADRLALEIRLVYYPAYHSKYNPIEHCWGVLEQKWGGTLLVSLKVILREALRMRWCGQSPTVKRLHGEYADGVRLTRTQMKPYEKRMKRSQTLPKYDITITPIQSTRQVG